MSNIPPPPPSGNGPTPGGTPPPPPTGPAFGTAPPPPTGPAFGTPPPAPGYGAPQYGAPAGAYGPPAIQPGVPPGYVQKEKLVAGLLGILIGSLGVHSFYLGHTGKGIAQIVVTIVTCGIGGLWGLIEGILILTGSINTDANGVPLKG